MHRKCKMLFNHPIKIISRHSNKSDLLFYTSIIFIFQWLAQLMKNSLGIQPKNHQFQSDTASQRRFLAWLDIKSPGKHQVASFYWKGKRKLSSMSIIENTDIYKDKYFHVLEDLQRKIFLPFPLTFFLLCYYFFLKEVLNKI